MTCCLYTLSVIINDSQGQDYGLPVDADARSGSMTALPRGAYTIAIMFVRGNYMDRMNKLIHLTSSTSSTQEANFPALGIFR